MKVVFIVIGFLFSCTILFTNAFAQNVPSPNNFGTIVYTTNGLYYVKDSQNSIIATSDVPDTVIKIALDRAGGIYISGGEYDLSKNFAGFELKSTTHLKLEQNAFIIVPSGYRGYVFKFNGGTADCIVDGGRIYEADPVARNWIGIMMQGNTNDGIYNNYIENMEITYPKIVIDFNATSGEWINANTFVNIKGGSFVTGIEFNFKGIHTEGTDGFSGNVFRDSQFQAGTMTTYGVKGIKHRDNAFYNIYFWDLPPNAIGTTIDTSATNTIIIGGRMTDQGFVDDGTNTVIVDALHNNLLTNSTLGLEIMNDTYKPQVNAPTHKLNQVLNMSIPEQQFVTGFINGDTAQLSMTGERPVEVNLNGAVNNPEGGKISLYITRPDGVVEQNQAFIKSDGSFYFPIIFDRNSLIGQYRVNALYQNTNLGELLITLTLGQTSSLPNEISSNSNNSSISEHNPIFTTSIKDDARLWSQGKISDYIFGKSIEHLAMIGVIENSNLNYNHTYIPAWFKNDAALWADGQIASKDFIAEIQYLLDSKMIQLSH